VSLGIYSSVWVIFSALFNSICWRSEGSRGGGGREQAGCGNRT
jgi:uncharacterized membrane-anchored protein YitT (DUF2179 family)